MFKRLFILIVLVSTIDICSKAGAFPNNKINDSSEIYTEHVKGLIKKAFEPLGNTNSF